MILFDVIQLCLVPNFTHSDRNTIAGRIWYATVEYILQRKEVAECHVAEKSKDDELWMLLVWKDAEGHDDFLDSSLGVGITTPFLRKPPVVYSFDKHPSLEIRQILPQLRLQLYQFHTALAEEETKAFEREWRRAWKLHTILCTWKIDDEYTAFLGLTDSSAIRAQHLIVKDLDATCYSELLNLKQQIQHEVELSGHTFNFPGSTPDLIRAEPTRYGQVSFDESETGKVAYPNDLEFRPMRYIASSSWFPHDEDYSAMPGLYERYMSVITISLVEDYEGAEQANFSAVCREVVMQSGLERFYWWIDDNDARTVRLITGWRDVSSYETFQLLARGPDSAFRNDSFFEREATFTSFPIEYFPDWSDGALVESLTFVFQKVLTREEKNAFARYLNQFLWTMMPESPSDASVVEPYGPFWFPLKELEEGFAVFLRWDGLSERSSWFQNFLANAYDVSGHLAHVLALISPVIRSSTVAVHKLDHS